MSTGMLVILIITAYFAGALASAPRLMRLIYQEKLAVLAEAQARHDKHMADWRANKEKSAYNMPLMHRDTSNLNSMHEARFEGFWWSLIWPFSLAFHALGATAFAQEIAAQQAAANAKVIADYDKLLAQRFDDEMATVPTKSGPLRIQRLFKEKH